MALIRAFQFCIGHFLQSQGPFATTTESLLFCFDDTTLRFLILLARIMLTPCLPEDPAVLVLRHGWSISTGEIILETGVIGCNMSSRTAQMGYIGHSFLWMVGFLRTTKVIA